MLRDHDQVVDRSEIHPWVNASENWQDNQEMRQHDCNLQRCRQDRKKTNPIKGEKIMSMYNDSVQDEFTILNSDGEVVATGLQQALDLVQEIDGDYLVKGDADEFEITSFINGLVANDLNTLLELLDGHGYRITWQDDSVDHDDVDDDSESIKDHLDGLGIKTNQN